MSTICSLEISSKLLQNAVSFKANMSFELDSCLDEYNTPAGKERAATHTGQYSPSRMGMTVIPSFDSTEVSFATAVPGLPLKC